MISLFGVRWLISSAPTSIFYAVVRYAVDAYRSKDGRTLVIADDIWNNIVGMDDPSLQALFDGSGFNLMKFHEGFSQRIIDEFKDITEVELSAPSRFWENTDLSLRFRLHRFESHLKQHTIQIEKILKAIDIQQTEIRLLLRMLYHGLDEIESGLIGAPDIGSEEIKAVSKNLSQRADEIADIIKKDK